MKILISACLLGQPVRYDGRSNDNKIRDYSETVARWQSNGWLIPVCPEVAGGLPTPRPAAEIIGSDGDGVIAGIARIRSASGGDFTAQFLAGAEQALALAKKHGAVAALLAARSPSCGSDGIYDGTFSSTQRRGMGVTAALLEQQGIRCFSPDNFSALEQYLNTSGWML
ncbi:DUF523 domain-containing protein [Thalassolituus sp. LLYu03]|uniref:DUF523 domain-containing protein n=1 Tax=Thalassolituus sp. LLYu03 TaxID=3421656 RepID=UPI003D27C4C7